MWPFFHVWVTWLCWGLTGKKLWCIWVKWRNEINCCRLSAATLTLDFRVFYKPREVSGVVASSLRSLVSSPALPTSTLVSPVSWFGCWWYCPHQLWNHELVNNHFVNTGEICKDSAAKVWQLFPTACLWKGKGENGAVNGGGGLLVRGGRGSMDDWAGGGARCLVKPLEE